MILCVRSEFRLQLGAVQSGLPWVHLSRCPIRRLCCRPSLQEPPRWSPGPQMEAKLNTLAQAGVRRDRLKNNTTRLSPAPDQAICNCWHNRTLAGYPTVRAKREFSIPSSNCYFTSDFLLSAWSERRLLFRSVRIGNFGYDAQAESAFDTLPASHSCGRNNHRQKVENRPLAVGRLPNSDHSPLIRVTPFRRLNKMRLLEVGRSFLPRMSWRDKSY